MVVIDKKLKKLIEGNALAFANVERSGKPHCIAVGFAKVVSKNQIPVTVNCIVRTVENIKKNPNVALAV